MKKFNWKKTAGNLFKSRPKEESVFYAYKKDKSIEAYRRIKGMGLQFHEEKTTGGKPLTTT